MDRSHRRARALGLAAAAFCLAGAWSTDASAYPATWEFKGSISELAGSDWPDGVAVGGPIRVVMTFDTNEPTTGSQGYTDPVTGISGRRYNYAGPRSLKFAIFAGADCNPCVPTDDPKFNPSNNTIIVRDNFPGDTGNGTPVIVTDGYSFTTRSGDGDTIGVFLRDPYNRLSPPIVAVPNGGNPLPVEPDPRIADMALAGFQVCQPSGDCLTADIEAVSVPTYGTYYFLSGRHCAYPDINPASRFFGDDCVVGGGLQAVVQSIGGSAGQGDFSLTVTHRFPTPSPSDAPDNADTLGTVFGAATFGGPGALPVLRGSSFPTEVGRTNANLLAYQEYLFGGSDGTPLQLVVDLGYQVFSNWIIDRYPDGRVMDEGVRPGGASIGTTLAVVDASKVPPAAMAALQNFNSLQCGAEDLIDNSNGQYVHRLPDGSRWPDGSILGAASYLSTEREQGSRAERLALLACNGDAVGDAPPVVNSGQRFYLTASMQAPARGSWSQPGNPQPERNGLLDAANTVRVIPDPEAPPQVLQQLAAGIVASCEDCTFEPELVIDVKPGSSDNSINVGSNGTIPVALFGSDRFNVRDVEPASLRLGTLSPRSQNGASSGCAVQHVNGDGLEDLVCHFQNRVSNWVPDQKVVTLTAVLANGESVFASDSVRLIR